MLQMKIPDYIINWTKSFLDNRQFKVKVNNSTSNLGKILAGVPQGAIISPLLFLIYINDIPQRDKSNQSGSELYADDLASFFIYGEDSRLASSINIYLNKLEKWLKKWKFKVSAEKCSYIIFSKIKQGKHYNLRLNNKMIPYCSEPKFLGITFDEKIKFDSHFRMIRKRCFERLKVIKILANKKWRLKQETLVSIYKTLVRSIIDYSSPIYNQINNDLKEHIAVVQNSAIRSIFKKDYLTSREILNKIGEENKLCTIENRMYNLSKSYFMKAIEVNNPLIIKIIREFKNGFSIREIKRPTPLCLIWNDKEFKNYII